MRKTLVTVALVGGTALAGAATVPGLALAQDATPSPSATATAPTGVVDRITEALSGLVSGGTLTQSQADAVAQTLASSDAVRGGHGGRGGRGGGVSLEAAATAIGVTEDELKTQLEAGKTLAAIAEAEGVSRATLVAALVDAAQERLAEEVAAGELTQAEADEKAAELQTRIEEKVDRAGFGPRGGGPRGERGTAPRTDEESSTPSATPSSTAAA